MDPNIRSGNHKGSLDIVKVNLNLEMFPPSEVYLSVQWTVQTQKGLDAHQRRKSMKWRMICLPSQSRSKISMRGVTSLFLNFQVRISPQSCDKESKSKILEEGDKLKIPFNGQSLSQNSNSPVSAK